MKISLSDIMRINEYEIIWDLRGWNVYQFGILIASRFPSQAQAKEYIMNRYNKERREK